MKYVPPSPSSTSMGAVFESSAAHVASTSRWIGGSCPLPSSVSVGVFAFALLTNRDLHASACGGAARGVGPVGEEGSEHMVTRPDEVVVEEEEEIEEMDDNVADSAFGTPLSKSSAMQATPNFN